MQTQYKDYIHLEEKWKKQNAIVNLNQTSKINHIFNNWPAIKMKKWLISSKHILKKPKIKKRDLGYFKSKMITTYHILGKAKIKY